MLESVIQTNCCVVALTVMWMLHYALVKHTAEVNGDAVSVACLI
jgi:hypothetical protein